MKGAAVVAAYGMMLAGLACPTNALDIPLVVAERAGVARVSNHVNAGIPLPRGAVKDVGQLALFRRGSVWDLDGDAKVPASFIVRERYPAGGSPRWMTVHFLCSPPANEKVQYVVKDMEPAEFPFPLKAHGSRGRVTVDTGTVKFLVTRQGFNVIDQMWYDPKGEGKYGKPLIDRGAAKLRLNVQAGTYRIVNRKASLDAIGDAYDTTAKVTELKLEEHTSGRAVVKAAGRFMQGITPTLDFVARIYTMAGSGAVRVSFTVINRSGRQWADFQGINELSLELPVKLGGRLKYSLSNSTGADATGPIRPGEQATLLQPHSESYLRGGVAGGEGKAKGLATRRLGWADLTGHDAGMVVGIRNFWQMHPKGLAVSGDGVLTIQLVPRQDKPAAVSPGGVSQALTRVDLFTGGARTHEFLLAAHKPDDAPRAVAMGVVDPLMAVAGTGWYCQDTQAEGPLWDTKPGNFKLEYRNLVAAFNRHAARSLEQVRGRRDGAAQGIEEYGLLNYGSGVEDPRYVARNDALNTRWDGNHYDFPRAALVNFWRTGNPADWDLAGAAALHLADVGIAHAHPNKPKLAGIERTCPNRGHFRQWWANRGEPFGVSGNMDSTRSQSLFDLYHMTGDAWYRDCGMLIAEYCMNHSGGSLRAAANRAKALLEAYEQTGEKRFLDEDVAWLGKMLLPRSPARAWDQKWMYGLAGEALADLYRATGEAKWAKAAVNCCDSLIANYWKGPAVGVAPLSGFTVNCFGYAYEFTGNKDYLAKGLVSLRLASGEQAGRTKAFAQEFRLSPYFLACLTKGYKPPKPVVTKAGAGK